MKKFGLACEGITDQITLENILCGFFEDHDLDDEITRLQPHLDKTDQKQKGFGGWEMLLDYLKSSRFKEDVINVKYIVLQLDSDIVEHPNFGISYRNDKGLELTIEELIDKTIIELVSKINSGDEEFYEKNKEKIIFAICVHSLECWLYAFYNNKSLSEPKIRGCGKALEFVLKLNGFHKNKDKQLYKEYSEIFLKRKNIDKVVQKDPSFKYFIQLLERATQATSNGQ